MQDLHFHFDDFKNTLEKDFKFLKEATSRNIKNFQTSLNLQQTYLASLCSHVNNIYSKLSELQRHIQNHHTHMNPGDTVQIEAPDFDPDIDGVSSPGTDEKQNELLTQGTSSPASEVTEPKDNSPPLQQLYNSYPLKIQIGQTLSPYKSPTRPNIILKALKFLIWRRILKKSSMPIWSHT